MYVLLMGVGTRGVCYIDYSAETDTYNTIERNICNNTV